MEIVDFANALRAMAGNVDVLAERHDVKDMAQLRRDAAQHEVDRRRDADLIDELRRQLAATTRYVEGIARLRRSIVPGDTEAVLAEALMVIDGHCTNFTAGGRCPDSSRSRNAPYAADAWCAPCVARDALERVGALPAEVD